MVGECRVAIETILLTDPGLASAWRRIFGAIRGETLRSSHSDLLLTASSWRVVRGRTGNGRVLAVITVFLAVAMTGPVLRFELAFADLTLCPFCCDLLVRSVWIATEDCGSHAEIDDERNQRGVEVEARLTDLADVFRSVSEGLPVQQNGRRIR